MRGWVVKWTMQNATANIDSRLTLQTLYLNNYEIISVCGWVLSAEKCSHSQWIVGSTQLSHAQPFHFICWFFLLSHAECPRSGGFGCPFRLATVIWVPYSVHLLVNWLLICTQHSVRILCLFMFPVSVAVRGLLPINMPYEIQYVCVRVCERCDCISIRDELTEFRLRVGGKCGSKGRKFNPLRCVRRRRQYRLVFISNYNNLYANWT